MTIKKLIEKLKKYDEDTIITVWDCYHDINTDEIEIREMYFNGEKAIIISEDD